MAIDPNILKKQRGMRARPLGGPLPLPKDPASLGGVWYRHLVANPGERALRYTRAVCKQPIMRKFLLTEDPSDVTCPRCRAAMQPEAA
jgi:hypothetical protein